MLDELVQDVVADFTDEEGEPLVASEYSERAAERALPQVAGLRPPSPRDNRPR